MKRALALVLVAAGCAAPPPTARDVMTVSVEQASAWVRNFNPLLVGSARWPTRGGIYEPLVIWNAVAGTWVPWLATDYAWSADHLTLTLHLRDGVRWSDGQPFTAGDVVFSYELLHKHRALDSNGLWEFLSGVRAVDAHTVELTLQRPFVPGLVELVQQPMLPEHIWSHIADPMTFTNPKPVGTGPFTEVRVFRNQVWELGRNPRYWQAGKPELAALRMIAYPSNDQANLALVDGEVDWAGNFVPAVQRTFVARDPQHNGFWFPSMGSMVFLYPNALKAPFDDVRVRKALSLAIDRERVVAIGMYGYSHPADATGLSDVYSTWRDPAVVADGWVGHDPAAAGKLLDDAGFPLGKDGLRHGKDGQPMHFTIEVVSGWSDWVRAAQVVSRDLARIGVTAELRAYEWGAWFRRLQAGDFQLAVACPGLAFSFDAPTPYYVYRWLMGSRDVKPLGELATTNWNRVGDKAADALFAELERTDDVAQQHAIVNQLERRFAAVAPAIPLFANPLWGAYNTRRITGFPTAEHPFAKLSPFSDPEDLLVLTALKPRAQ